MLQYKGTIVSATEFRLVVFSELIERTYVWRNNAFVPDVLTCCPTGLSFTTPHDARLPDFGTPVAKSTTEYLEDNGGLSEPHAAIKVTVEYADKTVETTYESYPGQPFVTTTQRIKGNVRDIPRPYVVDIVPVCRYPMTLTSVELIDVTDFNNTLARQSECALYRTDTHAETGHLFQASDTVHNVSLLIAKDAPTHLNALCQDRTDLVVKGNLELDVVANTRLDEDFDGWQEVYGTTVGAGRPNELLAQYKRHFRMVASQACKRSFAMSNTWGDRSQDARVCEAFLLKELDAAHELGLDIVQIDDGWQTGITVNSATKASGLWSGYYDGAQDFWKVNQRKFPNGLQPVCDKAREYGIAIGLWFSPDSSHDFANWQRDVETVMNLHRAYGIRYFKLDGINIQSKRGETNFLSFLAAIHTESGNSIVANMDITAQSRLGYLFKKHFGTLFVENRYTDHKSYYPHNTLRNLWTLSRYFPLQRFQFELLNNSRRQEVYGDEPLAPAAYTLDYEFAAVMLADPLFWMEVSSLTQQQKDTLKPAVTLYKSIRDRLADADVLPIGDMPDGRAFTGFQIVTQDSCLLLLFRELADDDTAIFQLPVKITGSAAPAILAANHDGNTIRLADATHAILTAPEKKTFVLAEFSK